MAAMPSGVNAGAFVPRACPPVPVLSQYPERSCGSNVCLPWAKAVAEKNSTKRKGEIKRLRIFLKPNLIDGIGAALARHDYLSVSKDDFHNQSSRSAGGAGVDHGGDFLTDPQRISVVLLPGFK